MRLTANIPQVVATSRQTWRIAVLYTFPKKSANNKHTSHREPYGQPALRLSSSACFFFLINNAAANTLFSLAAAGNNVAWGIPIMCRVVWGRAKFCPGPFYTGRFSVATAIAALLYLTFSTILCMFPTEGPDPDRKLFPWN